MVLVAVHNSQLRRDCNGLGTPMIRCIAERCVLVLRSSNGFSDRFENGISFGSPLRLKKWIHLGRWRLCRSIFYEGGVSCLGGVVASCFGGRTVPGTGVAVIRRIGHCLRVVPIDSIDRQPLPDTC